MEGWEVRETEKGRERERERERWKEDVGGCKCISSRKNNTPV